MQSRRIILALVIAILAILISLSIGSANIDILDTVNILFNKFFNIPLNPNISEQDQLIITSIRLPRVILAFLVGASLALAGCVTQSILNNPLATPYTLGVSSGASLGIGILIIFNITFAGLTVFIYPAIGFVFSALTIFLVFSFSSRIKQESFKSSIVLSGIIISLFLSSLLTVLTSFNYDKISKITMWQMGSLSQKGFEYIGVIILFMIIALIIIVIYIKELDIFMFGEENALSLGINVKKTKMILLMTSALLSAVCVSISGIIGFVDLMAPVIARKITKYHHKHLVIMSALIGGILLVVADTIARNIIAPSELPIGAITALIGAPFFCYIYMRKEV